VFHSALKLIPLLSFQVDTKSSWTKSETALWAVAARTYYQNNTFEEFGKKQL
jgi:hypothetical protein